MLQAADISATSVVKKFYVSKSPFLWEVLLNCVITTEDERNFWYKRLSKKLNFTQSEMVWTSSNDHRKTTNFTVKA